MSKLDAVTMALDEAGVDATPPISLLTRWLALLASEDPIFFDAVHESGKAVPGTRYTFLAVTESSVCYLNAEHDDEFWEYGSDRIFTGEREKQLIPRTLIAWRRPLGSVTEIGLGGNPWNWIPRASGESELEATLYALHFGAESVEMPLPSRRRRTLPDVSPVISRLTTLWRVHSA